MNETIVLHFTDLLWVVGIIGIPLLGWCIRMHFTCVKVREDVLVLVKMHREPDKYGFGTGLTNRTLSDSHRELTICIQGNTKAIQELVYYIKWLAKMQSGQTPPPPMGPPNE